MKTFIVLFTALFSLSMGVYAQEYYYWFQNKKHPLELVPTKKYISVYSADDTTALKAQLTESGIYVPYFVVYNSCQAWDKEKPEERAKICAAIVEGQNLPDLTQYEAVAYEGPFFKNELGQDWGGLDPEFMVTLKDKNDWPQLEQLAKDNNVSIKVPGISIGQYGSDTYGALIVCSKLSTGNSMELSHLFYDTGLFSIAEIGGFSYGSDAHPAEPVTGIAPPATKPAINLYSESGLSIAIETAGDLIEEVEVYDLSGKILYRSSYSGVLRANWKANQKGLYIVKIKLQSGNIVYRKIIV